MRGWVVEVRLVTVVTQPARKSADNRQRQIHFFAIAARELHTAKALVKVDFGKQNGAGSTLHQGREHGVPEKLTVRSVSSSRPG